MNRCAALLALGDADGARRDAEACVRMAPRSIKAHYRLAKAQRMLGDASAALEAAIVGIELSGPAGNALLSTLASEMKVAMMAEISEFVVHDDDRTADAAARCIDAIPFPAARTGRMEQV